MFIERSTIDIELLNTYFTETEVSAIDWSKVRICVPGSKTRFFDIGSWAYDKKRVLSRKTTKFIQVDISTEDKRMHGLIMSFASTLYYKHRMGRTTYTLTGEFRAFNHFINWLESSGSSDIFNQSSARRAYEKYSCHLEFLISSAYFVQSTASYHQSIARKTFANFFDTSENQFSSGIRTIHKQGITSKEPLLESEILKAYGLYASLFKQITPFLSNKEEYPLRLNLPQEPLYLFPITTWVATKERLIKRDRWTFGNWAWNYETGEINHFQKISHHYKTRKQCRSVIKQSKKNLLKANEDHNSFHRYRLGMLAHDSFFFLFIVNTGMNMSSLTNLLWEDQYELTAEHQGFRTVKNRAKGKVVEFQITSVFLPTFRKYLELRQYLLRGQHFDYLFFTKGSQVCGQNVKQLSHTILQNLHRKIKPFDLTIPPISASEIRAFKQDRLISVADIKVSSEIMQHTTNTALQYYSKGSQQEQVTQLTLFYKLLNKSVITTTSSTATQNSENIPIGHCKSNASPLPIDKIQSSIEPDCLHPEGCLFCQHYRIHADEKDIRKLASIRYIINESRYNAVSEEHFKKIYGVTLERIDSLLSSLKNVSKNTNTLVTKIVRDVDINENLSPYWQNKLNMLSVIGAI